MRMWMLPPYMMCGKHIAGEHGEIHKHRHDFVDKHSIKGRVQKGNVQIEPSRMDIRHDELAGYLIFHNSPYELPDLSYLGRHERYAVVDREAAHRELLERCPACRAIWERLEADPGLQERKYQEWLGVMRRVIERNG